MVKSNMHFQVDSITFSVLNVFPAIETYIPRFHVPCSVARIEALLSTSRGEQKLLGQNDSTHAA